MKNKIFVLCSHSTGIESVYSAIQAGLKIDRLIGLNIKKYDDQKVSGLLNIKNFCLKYKIKFSLVDNYNLNCTKSKKIFSKPYDYLWIASWQRLLPSYVIKSARIAIVGLHGSSEGINSGRGRSPQNWSLIMQKKFFYLSLFLVDEFIDSGKIILTEKVNYFKSDTIKDSYKKIALASSKMIIKFFSNPKKFIHNAKAQNDKKAEYLPQRKPEDGFIDWNIEQDLLISFINALTKPYPCAFTKEKDHIIKIISIKKFSKEKITSIGKITHVFLDKTFLVQSKKGIIMVESWENNSNWFPQKNMKFKNASYLKILNRILKNHIRNYPKKKINFKLLKFIKDFSY